MKKFLSETGDTLVEVLLAITALASVIGMSYSISTRAQRIAQLSQERSEATNVAQEQAERLRRMRDILEANPAAFTSAVTSVSPFCMSAIPVAPPFPVAAGGTCASGVNGRYTSSIVYSAAQTQFRITTSWVAAGNNPVQQVTLEYRL